MQGGLKVKPFRVRQLLPLDHRGAVGLADPDRVQYRALRGSNTEKNVQDPATDIPHF
jgi:hypothetical protein